MGTEGPPPVIHVLASAAHHGHPFHVTPNEGLWIVVTVVVLLCLRVLFSVLP
jgi:hypothetical protein